MGNILSETSLSTFLCKGGRGHLHRHFGIKDPSLPQDNRIICHPDDRAGEGVALCFDILVIDGLLFPVWDSSICEALAILARLD